MFSKNFGDGCQSNGTQSANSEPGLSNVAWNSLWEIALSFDWIFWLIKLRVGGTYIDKFANRFSTWLSIILGHELSKQFQCDIGTSLQLHVDESFWIVEYSRHLYGVQEFASAENWTWFSVKKKWELIYHSWISCNFFSIWWAYLWQLATFLFSSTPCRIAEPLTAAIAMKQTVVKATINLLLTAIFVDEIKNCKQWWTDRIQNKRKLSWNKRVPLCGVFDSSLLSLQWVLTYAGKTAGFYMQYLLDSSTF